MIYQLIGQVGRVFTNCPGDLGVVAIVKGTVRSPSTMVSQLNKATHLGEGLLVGCIL